MIQNGASPFSEPEIVYARKTDLEELARLRKEREWQPIETAPKDGSAFLAWEDGDRGPFKCWWHTDWPRAEAYWMDNQDSEPEPTHWQPLPARPEQGVKP